MAAWLIGGIGLDVKWRKVLKSRVKNQTKAWRDLREMKRYPYSSIRATEHGPMTCYPLEGS